jgi:hypothetical protein
MSEYECGSGTSSATENPVGIVVQDVRPVPSRPRAVAFVYGSKVNPQPSLPYGRWKRAERSAA